MTRSRVLIPAAAVAIGALVGTVSVALGIVALMPAAVLGLVELVRRLSPSAAPRAHVQRLLLWTLSAFVLHLLVGLATSADPGLAKWLGGDAQLYHDYGARIASHWSHGTEMPFLPDGKEAYYYLVGGIYWLVGPHVVAGLIVNAFLASAIAPIVTDTTERMFGGAAARYIAPMVVLIPGFIQWTSQLLKEPLALFLVAVLMNCVARALKRASIWPLLLIGLSLAVLFSVRSYVGLALAAGVVFGIALSRRQVLAGVGTGASSLIVVSVLVATSGLGYAGYKSAIETDFKQVQIVRQDLSKSATSGYHAEADVSSFTKAGAYLPRGFVAFVFGPFPWTVRSARHLLGLVDAMVWWALLPSLWRGLRVARKRVGRELFSMMAPAGAVIVLFSLSIGNFGAVLRERMQLLVIVLPLIALGLAARRTTVEAFRLRPELADASASS